MLFYNGLLIKVNKIYCFVYKVYKNLFKVRVLGWKRNIDNDYFLPVDRYWAVRISFFDSKCTSFMMQFV